MFTLAEVDWAVLAGHVLNAVLVIFGPLLALIGTWLAVKLGKKWKLEASAALQQTIESTALSAVHYAEGWADKLTKDAEGKTKPTGSEKLDKAMEFVEQALGNATVQKYGVDPLRAMIEAKLRASINADTTGETTGA